MCISYRARPAGHTASEDRINCQWAIIAIAIARPSRVFDAEGIEENTRYFDCFLFLFLQ